MPHATFDLPSAAQATVHILYAVAVLIWTCALALAGYRIYQMRTLTSLPAEVLAAGVNSYSETSRDTDSDNFTILSETKVSVAVVPVRYQFDGKSYTAEARHDTGGLEWVQRRVARRWKPGNRIRVHIDPAQPGRPLPDLGFNLHTFQMSIALAFVGCVFVLAGYVFGRAMTFMQRLMQSAHTQAATAIALAGKARAAPVRHICVDDEPLPVPMGTAKAIAGLVCSLAAPLFDPVGYAMSAVGLLLLWSAGNLSLTARLAATAVVVPPRLAPILLSAAAGPGEFSFLLNPGAPATSPGAWGWYGLLLAVCALALVVFSEGGKALLAGAGLGKADRPAGESGCAPILVMLLASLGLAWATGWVLGLKNDFDWVEAGAGGWELKHSVRGRVAVFTAETLASVEGREEGATDKPAYRIRFAFKNGETRAMSTRSLSAFAEMKKLAATAQLPPERMRLHYASGETWSNGPFSLTARTGTYRADNGDFVELRLDPNGRLTGAVSAGGGEKPMRAVKVTEDGGIEYRTGVYTGASGKFLEDELMIDGILFRKPGK